MELRDLEIETPREEMPRRGRVDDSALYSRKKSLVLKAAGPLLLIILLVVFFRVGGNKGDTKELDAVESRLKSLEQQLARIEAERGQIIELQADVRSLQMLTESMKDRVEELARPAPPTPIAAAPEKNPNKKIVHVVRGGETLFSIAKKYGMRPDELSRDNHISKNIIQPGQKLVVDPGV